MITSFMNVLFSLVSYLYIHSLLSYICGYVFKFINLHVAMVPNDTIICKLTWKSGHLDNVDTFGWYQCVHNIHDLPL